MVGCNGERSVLVGRFSCDASDVLGFPDCNRILDVFGTRCCYQMEGLVIWRKLIYYYEFY
jgi:hypothetical protein